MVHLQPVGGTEFKLNAIHERELKAIKSILAMRGEHREIERLWWHARDEGYYMQISTPDGEPTSTHFISLDSVVAEQNK